MGESIIRLTDLLDQRRLTIDEVLAWTSAIATELSTLHGQGRGHGDVVAGNIFVEGNHAHLAPPSGQACADQTQDIVQFAALLRTTLDTVQVETEAESALWRALDSLAATNSLAGSGSRMKKVASALKVLCSARRIAAPARIESPAEEPVIESESGRQGSRILMLVREVPPVAPANPRRFRVKIIHIWAFLVSAAAVAVIGCVLFLRFIK